VGPCAKARAKGLAQHPVRRLLAAGVPCCLNADDPLYWAAADDGSQGLLREYQVAREIMNLDDHALAELARHSFIHSSAPKELIDKGLAAIEHWLDS